MYFVKDFKHFHELVNSLNNTNHCVVWFDHLFSTVEFNFSSQKVIIKNHDLLSELKRLKNYYLTSKYLIIVNDDLNYSLSLAGIDVSGIEPNTIALFQDKLSSLPTFSATEVCDITGYNINQLYRTLNIYESVADQYALKVVDLIRVYQDAQPILILNKIKAGCSGETLDLINSTIDKYRAIINAEMKANYKNNFNKSLSGFFKDIFLQIIDDVKDNKYILDAIDSYLS